MFDKKLYLTNLSILVLGTLPGLTAAYYFNLIAFDFSGEEYNQKVCK